MANTPNIEPTDGNWLDEPETFCRDHLRVPLTGIDLGEPRQTLAALGLAASEKQGFQTYAARDALARVACVPEPTLRDHMAKLASAGYIRSIGRRAGRRTPTWELTALGKAACRCRKFLRLPRAVLKAFPDLTWAQRLVLAVVIDEHIRAAKHNRPRRLSSIAIIGKRAQLCERTTVRARAALVAAGLLTATFELAHVSIPACPSFIADIAHQPGPKREPVANAPKRVRQKRTPLAPDKSVVGTPDNPVVGPLTNPSLATDKSVVALKVPLELPKKVPKQNNPAGLRPDSCFGEPGFSEEQLRQQEKENLAAGLRALQSITR